MIMLYGKKVKKLFYANSNWVFNNNFFNFLILLEIRLNIILLRMSFVLKLLQGNHYIKKKLILVNGLSKKKNYLVCSGDLIQYNFLFNKAKKRIKFLKWRKFKWKKWKKRYNKKKKVKFFFWRVKKNRIIINYIEINYKLLVGIFLRKPFISEILIRNNRKLLSITLFKKIYFIY